MITLRKHEHCKMCGATIPKGYLGQIDEGLRWAMDEFAPYEMECPSLHTSYSFTVRVPRVYPISCDACAEESAKKALRGAFEKKGKPKEEPEKGGKKKC